MKIATFLSISLTIALSATSCVSYQKYEDALSERDEFREQSERTSSELEDAKRTIEALQEERASLEKQLREAKTDLRTTRDRYQQLNQANNNLMERYDRILEQNEKMLETSSEEKQELMAELTAKQAELDRREQALRRLESEIEQREEDVEQLRQSLQERVQRVNELESAIREKEEKLSSLRSKINEALLGFSDTDLSVQEKGGKVYVSLSQNLLFPSGSKTINANGKDAIRKVARVLKDKPDIAITVEGHTDTDGNAAFNWDLSVGRATSVVKELTKNGVDPSRITAAGRGEFQPVASNKTPSGKAKNRRTEIILSPRLDALYDIINE